MSFLYEQQLKNIKKNLTAHNEMVKFRPANDNDIFYLKNCKIPESVLNYYEHAEPDDVVEINDARIWPISVLKLENERMEPGSSAFKAGYFVIGTTIFGDCYCLNLNKTKNKTEPAVVLVYHERHKNFAVNNMQEVAKTFSEFLTLFSKGKLIVD